MLAEVPQRRERAGQQVSRPPACTLVPTGGPRGPSAGGGGLLGFLPYSELRGCTWLNSCGRRFRECGPRARSTLCGQWSQQTQLPHLLSPRDQSGPQSPNLQNGGGCLSLAQLFRVSRADPGAEGLEGSCARLLAAWGSRVAGCCPVGLTGVLHTRPAGEAGLLTPHG